MIRLRKRRRRKNRQLGGKMARASGILSGMANSFLDRATARASLVRSSPH